MFDLQVLIMMQKYILALRMCFGPSIYLSWSKTHTRKLKKKFKSILNKQHVICLGIPDDYEYMDEELVNILKNKVPQFVY